jgi:two-component system chemotaxis response regulator CheB
VDSDPAIEIMGAAADPFDTAEKMKKQVPDVITLDVEMPRMDGIKRKTPRPLILHRRF